MKKYFTICLVIFFSTCSFAQPTHEQRIEDTVLGWWSQQNINEIPKPFQYLGRTFTTKQQQNMKTVIEWMKKSYIPVSGLGTFKTMIYANNYSFPPHSYGVDFRVWNVSFMKEYLDAQGRFKPVSEEYTRFYFGTNDIMGSSAISFINNPSQYVFAMVPDGFSESGRSRIKLQDADLWGQSAATKYITRITDYMMTVYLVPDNKLPIVAVTKGELLDMVESAVPKVERLKGNTKYIEQVIQSVRKIREKHKSSLNEPAVLADRQPDVASFDDYNDPFELPKYAKERKQYYPVYKIEKAVLEKCKSDQPQWIFISFPFKPKEDGNQLYEMYKALTENFNYDYVYNYFFNPEKVKGIAYTPLNEQLRNDRLDVYRKRAYWKNPNEGKTLPPNIYFTDDFASNMEGAKPRGWFSSSRGKHPVVTTMKGLPGKWVQLGFRNAFSPNTSLKKPLPENFSIEFDAATDEFNSRTGGAVTLYLGSYAVDPDGRENRSGNGTVLTLNLCSGNEADFNNNNYRGNAVIRVNSKPELNIDNSGDGISFTYDLRQFNNKKVKIHVLLKVIKGEVTLFIDNKQVMTTKDFKTMYGKPCISCGVPAGTIFKTIYFDNTTNDWGVEGKSDGVDVYISNVKITKE